MKKNILAEIGISLKKKFVKFKEEDDEQLQLNEEWIKAPEKAEDFEQLNK